MTNCAARGLHLLDELLREVASRVVVPRFPLTPPEEIMRSAGGEFSTPVDHEAEEALTRGLAKMRPGTRVIGEEAASARQIAASRIGAVR
jgi:fructose-1,6-bisphosphatase/inositol monophosphatase family enzyme